MIIGLVSFARGGKDTLGRGFLDVLPNGRRYAFADELKNRIDPFLTKEFGISAFTNNDEEKLLIRPMLVAYGAGIRKKDPDFWVNHVMEQILAEDNFYSHHIITDVRYENEARIIQEAGGKVIYLTREGISPANDEELNSIPPIKNIADITIDLPDYKNNLNYSDEDLKEISCEIAVSLFTQLKAN